MGELKKRCYKTEINNCFLYTSDCLSLSENCSICTHGGRKGNLVYAPITINLYFKFNIFKMKGKKTFTYKFGQVLMNFCRQRVKRCTKQNSLVR